MSDNHVHVPTCSNMCLVRTDHGAGETVLATYKMKSSMILVVPDNRDGTKSLTDVAATAKKLQYYQHRNRHVLSR